MSKRDCRCDKCLKNKKNESIRKRDTIENSREAAIVVMVDEDDLASAGSGKLYFTQGIGNIRKKFVVSKDGSNIRFKYPGLYRIQFEGLISSESKKINLEFRRTPDFEQGKKMFSKFPCESGEISKTTLLPFHQNDELELMLISEDDSPVIIGKTSRLLIIRVDDI